MPSFSTFLSDKPLEFIHILARGWNLDLPESSLEGVRLALDRKLRDGELVAEVVAALPSAARQALAALVGAGGRVPLDQFSRRYGEIRQMGPARLAREHPERSPVSPAEKLYFLGLAGLAHFDTGDGPREHVYVPDDLLPLLPALPVEGPAPLGRPARGAEYANARPATDALLDDATTLLAALRSGMDPETGLERFGLTVGRQFLLALLRAQSLVDPAGQVKPDAVRAFLETEPGAALAALVQTWLAAPDLDELRLLPGLAFEGTWQNDPLQTRRAILTLMDRLPDGEWWNLAAFIAAVREHHFDFQRTGEAFNAWYILDADSGKFLRGQENWEQVEGRLLDWFIRGPLHWLGLVDLAGTDRDGPPLAFRRSAWSRTLLEGELPARIRLENGRVHVRSNGRISAGTKVPRAVRYLLSRFCDWEEVRGGEYAYRPTPASLLQAADAGLQVEQLIALLAKHSDGIPPNVTMALKNWQRDGQAARIKARTVLQVPTPEALQALRASRAARFLGEILGPTAVVVATGAETQVVAVLMELGYLGEVRS